MTNPSSRSTVLPASLTVFAPAKINLVLRILDRRPDGYHNLWSLMQTVQLEDELSISLSDNHSTITLRCDDAFLDDGPFQPGLSCRGGGTRSTVDESLDWTWSLAKRIPMGAGLGGGSSDAAATIIGLNRLLNLGWSMEKMAHVGQTLGSDVPFFFFAPSAIVEGRGEKVDSGANQGEPMGGAGQSGVPGRNKVGVSAAFRKPNRSPAAFGCPCGAGESF